MPGKNTKRTLQRWAGYSTELGMLRDTLKGGINPHEWSFLLPEYLQETDPASEHTDGDDTLDWFYSASPEQLDGFKSWLEEHPDVLNSSERDYDQPIGMAMDWRGHAHPSWNVHFTNDANGIASNGFAYGHPELHGLHLTTHKRDAYRTREPGYNFAFPARSRDAYNAEREGKYGDEAVLFYSGGADVYHHGDEENQRIFWGKNVDPRMIFPIYRDDERGGWVVYDAYDRPLVHRQKYDDIVRWVQTNYPMLQNSNEKRQREERQRLRRQKERQKTASTFRALLNHARALDEQGRGVEADRVERQARQVLAQAGIGLQNLDLTMEQRMFPYPKDGGEYERREIRRQNQPGLTPAPQMRAEDDEPLDASEYDQNPSAYENGISYNPSGQPRGDEPRDQQGKGKPRLPQDLPKQQGEMSGNASMMHGGGDMIGPTSVWHDYKSPSSMGGVDGFTWDNLDSNPFSRKTNT